VSTASRDGWTDPLPPEVESALVGLEDLGSTERDARVAALCDRHAGLAPRIRAIAAALGRLGAGIATGPEPERIGPYRVLEKLGEGGMGAVYLCQQDQPVRMRVAVKLVRVGMATKEVLARFEAERQALALMNHPGIARVLGAGATADGWPYFVMEHVPGVTLLRYCDEYRLSVRERLGLLVQIAEAVQHAHHKGVIHRDLKPQNVLVTVQDGKAVPKIIDFGLAKATRSPLTDATLYTEQGRVLGTPEYMSPEQADLTGLDVDTRTDVYALGVILYELLTGELPFDPAVLRRAGLAEMQRVIREVEPRRPSTRVPTSVGARKTADRRRTDVPKLVSELRGELDWITLKALAKDRTRRYATPLELAADVSRHLRGEPVLAGAPSGLYRVRKFVSRHRTGVTALATVVMALAVGLAVALHARGQLALALVDREQEAKRARASAEQAERSLEELRLLADVTALPDLVREADHDLWPAFPDRLPALRRWLARAEDLRGREADHRARLAALDEQLARPDLDPTEREETRWRRHHEELLVAGLRALAGTRLDAPTLDSVRRRIADAERAAHDMRVTHAEAWRRAIATIADPALCPRYGGAQIDPVPGLVPLGRNEHTRLYEFWHPASGDRPEWAEGGSTRVTARTGMVLVLVPAGTFWMGAQSQDRTARNHDPEARKGEAPVRQVSLDAFFIARHEVTQAQWERWTGERPSAWREGMNPRDVPVGDTNPVESVSWQCCVEVLLRVGLGLPTEAQFEYACRAGTSSPFSTGDDVASLRGAANIADEGSKGTFRSNWLFEADFDDGHAVTAPVGSFAANGFGLFDMAGNVSEWCLDEALDYDVDPRPRDGARIGDGTGPRTFRGGSYYTPAYAARSAFRASTTAGHSVPMVGVRAVYLTGR